jgi:RimJ/RimL family protein N-acetyltransferase
MITLRKTEEKDISLIASCLENKPEDFISQCGYGKRYFTFPVTSEQILNFQKSRDQNSLFFTVFNGELLIGSFELIMHQNEEKGVAATIARFLIYDEYRFKGYGTEALKLLANYAFDKLGLKKIRLGVFDFNESALNCYKKAGFAEVNRVKIDDWIKIDMELIKK